LDILARAINAGAFAIAGWQIARVTSDLVSGHQGFMPWSLVGILVGLLFGATLGPYITVRPIAKGFARLTRVPISTLVASILGLLVGLVIAVLISIPLFTLQGWLGWGVPIIVMLTVALFGLWLGAQKAREVWRVLPHGINSISSDSSSDSKILVDTSAIIDGRIADLNNTGFIQGTLLVPRFILDELRHIADSNDSIRRVRGRRGFEVLSKLRHDRGLPIEVLDVDALNGVEVDGQLVKLAMSMNASILTTDFNLNRVADLQGVKVLNINELANALKPVVLPGEDLTINVVQEGKEAGQGVGYLDDGTMLVVEGGKRYVNTLCDITVTRVLQTSAGRIIFAQPRSV